MTKKTALDEIDYYILSQLQKNGRMTNIELARRIGISAPPVFRRVKRLEALGVIKNYHAVLDADILGWSILFYVLVGLDGQKTTILEEFEHYITQWEETKECHMIRGDKDFLLHLVARDTAHQNLLTKKITDHPHVVKVQTFQVIRTSCERLGVPI